MEQNKPTKIHSLDDLRNLQEGSIVKLDKEETEEVLYIGKEDSKYQFLMPSLGSTPTIVSTKLKESQISIDEGRIKIDIATWWHNSYVLSQKGDSYNLAKQALIDAGLWKYEESNSQPQEETPEYRGPDRCVSRQPDQLSIEKDNGQLEKSIKKTCRSAILPKDTITLSTLENFIGSAVYQPRPELERLEYKLREAIRNEDYESAATLRDKIKQYKIT